MVCCVDRGRCVVVASSFLPPVTDSKRWLGLETQNMISKMLPKDIFILKRWLGLRIWYKNMIPKEYDIKNIIQKEYDIKSCLPLKIFYQQISSQDPCSEYYIKRYLRQPLVLHCNWCFWSSSRKVYFYKTAHFCILSSLNVLALRERCRWKPYSTSLIKSERQLPPFY